VEDHGKIDKSPGGSVSTGDLIELQSLHTIKTLYNPPHSKQEWLSGWWLNRPSEQHYSKLDHFPKNRGENKDI